MSMTIRIEGAERVRAALAALGRKAAPAAARALRMEHEEIMTKAKARTPVETGALRGSGRVEPSEIQGSQIVSRGGFGGAAAPYAVYVHENLAAHHPVGQAKFYESALTEAERGMADRFAKELERDLQP